MTDHLCVCVCVRTWVLTERVSERVSEGRRCCLCYHFEKHYLTILFYLNHIKVSKV